MMRTTVFNRAIILDAEKLLHSAVDDINVFVRELEKGTWAGGSGGAVRLLRDINQRLLAASDYLLYSDGYADKATPQWLTTIH